MTASLSASVTLDAHVAELLAQLSVEEKAGMLAGVDDWHLRGIPRLGIPSIRVTDCGHGVSLCGDRASPSTCLPTGIGMASTWNTALIERAGRVIGRETRALGCSIMLGPKINLHRHPLNGRSFETFSEDPHLAGMLAGALIRGIQSEGVAACVKAVAANNQQKDQGIVSSEVDERTLRELYLRAFEIAIQQGDPQVVMTSYNMLNGVYTSESRWLLTEVIKKQWKFPGFIVSDWRAVHTAEVFQAGLDLEMPGPGKLLHRQGVLEAVHNGRLSLVDLDDKVRRLLRVIVAYGKPEETAPEVAAQLDSAENRALALALAEESIVLLKNENNVLPLDAKALQRVLVVGPNAAVARLGGGGSASVTPFYAISPLDGIRELIGPTVEVQYMEGCTLVGTMEPIRDHLGHYDEHGQIVRGITADFFTGPEPLPNVTTTMTMEQIDHSWGWASPCAGIIKGPFAVRFSGVIVPPVSGRYSLGVHSQEGCVHMRLDDRDVISAWDGEANGNFEARYQTRYATFEYDFTAGVPVRLDLLYGKRAARAGIRLEWEIPGTPSPIAKAVAAARTADAVILCTGLSNLFEGGAQDRTSIDIPETQQQLINQISAVNPRTIVVLNNGGPLALPWSAQVPAIVEAWYPGQEGGRALARILFGVVNPSGRLPDTLAHRLSDHDAMRNYPGTAHQVIYDERLSVGYRHFDTAGIAPHFPFGFGLSYTSFTLSPPQVSLDRFGNGNVRVRVRNTGHRHGKEVVQCYIAPQAAPVSRPPKELRGFAKVDLAPGEETDVVIPLTSRDFAYYDVASSSWVTAPGQYDIAVGQHSRSLQAQPVRIDAS